MSTELRWRDRLLFFLVVAACFLLMKNGHTQGLKRLQSPPGVVELFKPAYKGIEHFFVDSTLVTTPFSTFRRKVRLDSTQKYIIIEETVYNRPYRLPIMADLDYYVMQKTYFDFRQDFRQAILRALEQRQAAAGGGIELNIPVKIKSKAFKRIFGGDRVGLRVSGNISFELAGRTESQEGSAVSSIEQRGNFAPKFKQTQQFRVEGRVGDKVTVSVDQNSEATFDFENTLKLTYEGDEDEIVQRIEAGNVALSLPSTKYVSTNASHQGLFGLKTKMQVGNLSFTGIASLERGENETLNISGSSRENSFRIRDYEYVRDRFFFIDDFYRDWWEESLDTVNMQLNVIESRYIRQLDVWKTTTVTGNPGQNETFQGFAFADSVPSEIQGEIQPVQGVVEQGRFKRLTEGIDYEFDFARGYFFLKSQPDDNEVIAIAYSYGRLDDLNPTKVGMLFQDIDSLANSDTTVTPTIALKLIKARTPKPTYPTWDLSMRNVYNLGASGISAEGFNVRVLYSVTGEDQEVDQSAGKTYNYLMGLDRLNEQGDPVSGGDKQVDLRQSFIFDLRNGYLFFPSKTPFAPTRKFGFTGERHVNIYDIKDPTKEREESKFELEVTTTSVSSTFELGFNVLEGSEKVRLNGRELQRDKDYTIDYFSGTLEVTAPEARRADAQLDIEYQRGALFQLDKKTMLGGRLEYKFGEKNFVGLTSLFYSKSTLDQRVRLGQEPSRNFIWDINSAFSFKPNILTKLFDKLPIVETSAESNLRIEAEFAQVNPNPNTFNEPKLKDNDGVAYIDDFEGSKRFTSLGIQYLTWTPASVPIRFSRLLHEGRGHGADPNNPRDYILEMDRKRIKFNWFNPFLQVPVRSIFPDRDVTAATGTTTTVLNLRWQNNNVSVDSAWAGIMRSTISFPDQQKTKFIEMWVRGNTGQVNIDVGRISEDYWVRGEFQFPNGPLQPSYGNLNTEDFNFNGLLDVEEGEDVGIDGWPGVDGSNAPGDAGDDDWADPRSTRPQFDRINGTEGNSDRRGSRFPDTEDLDGDGSVNLFNDYFEYSFDLSDPHSPFFVSETRFDDGTPTGWKLYRIPLSEFRFKVGDPDTTFQQVLYVRLWMNNLEKKPGQFDSLQIATFDFVGNEWEEEGVAFNDTLRPVINEDLFGITVYNTDEHSAAPTNYISPPNVSGIRDRITKAVSKEQSLVMELIELPDSARAEAKKQFREPINLINYKRLKMFVYGRDLNADTGQDSVVFFLRFGPTDKIFYEYRQPVFAGWATKNEMIIDFEELARTKQEEYIDSTNGVPDSINGFAVHRRPDPNFPWKEFLVVGNPGLHNIRYFVIGAVNLSGETIYDKEIWLDEMRVTGVERQKGTAMRLMTDLTLADIGAFRAEWELVDDNFRKLQQQFASTNGKDQTKERQTYNASLKLQKFLPESWGLEIPIDGRITRSRDVPKYFYNSDQPTNYELSGTNKLKALFGAQPISPELEEQISFTRQRSIGGTIKRKNRPKDPWYLRYSLNQLTLDLDWSERDHHNPTVEFERNTTFRSSFSFKVPFGKKNYIKPFSWMGKSRLARLLSGQKFYYTPTSANMNMSLNDNATQSKNRLETLPSAANISVKTSRKFTVNYKLLENLQLDFTRDYQSDPRLAPKDSLVDSTTVVPTFGTNDKRARDVINDIFTKFNFGQDRRISQRFGMRYNPKLFSWLSSNYTYTSDFIYSLDRPQINARNANLNKNQNIHVDFKLATLLSKIYNPKYKTKRSKRSKRGGRQGSNRNGKEEQKKEDKDGGGDKKKSSRPGLKPPNPLKLIWSFLNGFKSISMDFKFQDSYSHNNLERIPVWQYQFGFRNTPQAGVDTTFNKAFIRPTIKNTEGVDGSVQLDLVKSLKASLKYNYQKVDNQTSQQRTQSISNTVFFTGDDPDADKKPWWDFIPDWRLTLSGVEKWPLFKKFARTATLEHSRSGKFTESSKFIADVKNRDNWSYNISYQPFLGLSVNTIWGVSANLRMNNNTTIDYRTAGAVTRRQQSGINFSLAYSVTKGFHLPLPFLNKKRLQNEIQFQLAFDKTNSSSFSKSVNDADFSELDVSNSWKFRPSITYRFSPKVNGTAFYEQSSSTNKRTGTTSAKEFGINVNIAIR